MRHLGDFPGFKPFQVDPLILRTETLKNGPMHEDVDFSIEDEGLISRQL